eukprot:CAMPEP_0174832842 /NCGR_PEP_ID=MMETSP1114-20130205/3886_1 /TAXON_ID=312471 /ORGANISM="Neobodo designis, Strain CCAP 1951/1" /LENGTH=360 /DNA_ID=CAMNT_0016066709 /DNA_START=65 /DNA_END=1147 /DNA_ORIENTATION=+
MAAENEVLGGIFSDVDGTIVHYKPKLEGKLGYKYLGPVEPARTHELSGLPIEAFEHIESKKVIEVIPVPSATLGGGYISLETLRLVSAIRKLGVKFVLITGARCSTFFNRINSKTLPEIDYGVNEGGGRVWDASLKHDDTYTDRWAKECGPWRDQLDMDSAEKQGPLWDVYRLLAKEDALGPGTGKAKMDGASFVTSFMVTVGGNVHPTLGMADVTEEEKVLRKMTEEELKPKYNVEMCINLGKAQFAPVGVNKRTALEYVAKKVGVSLAAEPAPADGTPKKVACALFDDENDLGFASACSLGFAPSVAHPSVIPALEELGPRFQRSPIQGLLGTEYALTQLHDMAVRAGNSAAAATSSQ